MKGSARNGDSQGMVLVIALVLMLIAAAVAGGFLALVSNDARITRMAIDQQKAGLAAEAGLEYGVLKLKEIVLWSRLSPLITATQLQARIDAISPPAGIGSYAYVTPGGASAFRIRPESGLTVGVITNGNVGRGSSGSSQLFSITCGCLNTNSGMGAVRKQTVQALGLYLIRYGVFYDDDLEILPGPTMDFFGRVHSNGDIYLGGPLTFYESLTSHGNIYHRRKDDSSRPGEARICDQFGNPVSMILNPGEYLDCDHPDWMTRSLTRWQGNVQSGVHGIPDLRPPIDPGDMPHDIIERPLTTNNPAYNPITEREKFANRAALRIHVDSNGVFTAADFHTNDVTSAFSNAALTVSSYDGGGRPVFARDADAEYVLSTNGQYDVTQQYFWDQREGAQMAPVDIFIDQLIETYPALHDGTYSIDHGDCIVYITRDDPDGPGTGVIPCVRLRNGREITPGQGLSIVSDLPLYVEGNYNVVGTRPSLVAGDAVTFLSSAWQDARSADASCNTRVAASTDYNTVVMTGNSETSWGTYNGGLENVLRFLEQWSGETVTYRGSIIDLWHAEGVTNNWSYGQYYTAPNRNWGYDSIYLTQNPPGMTVVLGMEELYWTRTTWDAEGW
ncbi:hypothetical protein ACFLSJ_05770 [Verrucomicrobiota bacterium]